MDTKRCCKCRVPKPLDKFSRDRARKDGHRPYCKRCQRIMQRGKPGRDREAIRRRDPTQGEIEQRKAAIRAENFQREMAGKVVTAYHHSGPAGDDDREPIVYQRYGHADSPLSRSHSPRTTQRERMGLVRI